MATADPAALDDFLNTFRTKVDSGFGLISSDVSTVFASLVAISVGLTALLWILDENQNITAALVRKVLLVGFFAWLIGSWHTLATLVVEGFATLGLKAGAGGLSLADFMGSPSKVINDGFVDAFALISYIGKISREGYGLGFFGHFDVILVAALSAVGIIIAFIVLGVEIAVTIIEFHIVTLIAFVTVPFGVLAQTAFMSERAVGYVVSIGVKLMALALVVSIGESIFSTYTVSADPTASEECGLLLAAVLMLMLALKIPSIAGGLISGGPQLTAGSAFSGVAGVAATVGGVVLAARAAGAGLVEGGAVNPANAAVRNYALARSQTGDWTAAARPSASEPPRASGGDPAAPTWSGSIVPSGAVAGTETAGSGEEDYPIAPATNQGNLDL